MQPFLLAIFLLGYVLLATLGAWTRLAFQWPAYLVIAVGGLVALLRLRKGFKFSPGTLCLLSTLLFTGYCAARAWFSPVEYLARQDLLPLAACLVGYTLFALHVEHPKYRRWFAVTLTVLILLNFGIGVYQAQYDRTWSPYHWLGYARTAGPANAGGFFHSENHLAGFLEGSIYFLASFALFARIKLVWRMAALFSLMLALVVLVLTYSRAGLASVGVGLAAFGVLSLWLFGKFLGPQFWKYLAAFGVLFALLGAFLLFLCRDFLQDSYRGSGGLFGDGQFRLAYTQLALRQWETSPVWGTGARTFGIYAREFTTKDEDWNGAQAVDPDIAHNDYAQLLGDYGAVGFGLGMLLLLTHLGNGLRFLAWYRNVRYERTGDLFSNSLALALGAVCAVVAYTAHTAIDFNLHIPANALLVAALFGLLANPGFESDGRRHLRLPGLKTALTLLAAAGAGWTLWLGWRAAPAEIAYQQGLTRTHVGDYLGALTPHRRAAELDPAHQPNYMAFGTAYVGLAGDEEIPSLAVSWREKAIEQFRAALALNPRDALAHINLAEQLSQTGRERAAEAETHYLEAIRQAPALVVFRGRYGFHLLRHGQADKAADVWEETLKKKWYDADSLVARNLMNKIREAQKGAVPAPGDTTEPAAGAAPAPAPAPVPAAAPERAIPEPVPAPGPAEPPPEPATVVPPTETTPVAPTEPKPAPATDTPSRGLLSLPDPPK
jgi:O-antigen ligase/Flp pilus assembly protein TadD